MNLHLYFFHKNFRQITMASYFYLVKATVQKKLSCINFSDRREHRHFRDEHKL